MPKQKQDPQQVLRCIIEAMFPAGRIDEEWSADTLDSICGILDNAGYLSHLWVDYAVS